MKSILIIGASNAGKSTTMREVCKKLSPSKVYRLYANKNNLEKSRIELSDVKKIFNDTFIIEIDGKFVLVVAGAPTEQKIKITILIEICIELKINISFILVSMRSFERSKNFDTPNELKKKSEIVLTEKIHIIKDEKFEDNIEWNKRINKIADTLKSNI
jgi:hypothetical protein